MNFTARCIASFVLLCVIFAGPGVSVEAQTNSELFGGWIVTNWEDADGQDAPVPGVGLFLYTESGQYSMMFVTGEARKATGDDPTDADLAAAYNGFIANSGRYSVTGGEIMYEAAVAKDPAYMSQFEPLGGEGNAATLMFRVEGDTLTLEFGGDGPMEGWTATLRRAGSGA
jgi:hypothetical protein